MAKETQTDNTPDELKDSNSLNSSRISAFLKKHSTLEVLFKYPSKFTKHLTLENLLKFAKIIIIVLFLLTIFFAINKIFTPEGIVILPFDIGKKENISGIEIADQLTEHLIRIDRIHGTKYDDSNLRMILGQSPPIFLTEESLGIQRSVVPKATIVEYSMADVGNIDIGTNSIPIGKLITAFKCLCPYSGPVAKIRGSLQRYDSTIVLVALLEDSKVQSWELRQPIDSNGDHLHEMINNLSFMIAHDLPKSSVSAKTWEGLKYCTEALDYYNQYNQSGNMDFLNLSSNSSLEAIKYEKGYKNIYDLLLLLESTYIKIKRLDIAIEYCNNTVELDNTSAYGWYNKGVVFYNYGQKEDNKLEEAIKAFNNSTELDPKYALAWNTKAQALNILGRYDEAIVACNKSIEIDPNYAWAYNNKAWILKSQGDSFIDQGNFDFDKAKKAYNEAIKACYIAIKIDPKYAWPWNNKGAALNAKGELFERLGYIHNAKWAYDEALKACDKAIELDPNFDYARTEKDRTQKNIKNLGMYDEAIAWSKKGDALNAQGNFHEAINCYDKATELNPRLVYAWNNKGANHNAQGNRPEAINCYDKAIEINPKSAVAWAGKGWVLIGSGKYDEAIEACDKAIEIDQKSAKAWAAKSLVLCQLGKKDEAIKACDKAYKIDENIAEYCKDCQRLSS
jgi:tetratricopeptide (TPR) repeat protein